MLHSSDNNLLSTKFLFLKEELKTELEQIMLWWQNNMIDEEKGGFYGRIDGHGRLFPDANKGIILNTRILWAFSASARLTGEKVHLAIATRAYDYILKHFKDKQNGGLFWLLDHNGKVVSGKKQIYAQAFGIYALTEYFLLSQDAQALEEAQTLFDLIEKYSFQPKKNGYLEAFDTEWNLLGDMRLSEWDANEAKTMNTHLHILEAYTNLYRVDKRAVVKKALQNLIECFLEQFINPTTFHLKLFFDEDWNSKSDEISYGHDIECSWLLSEAAEVLGDDKLLHKVETIAISMAKSTLLEGTDTDGSVYNELKEGHLDPTKIWWVQAEATVGFWNAWQLSSDITYLETAQKSWSFIKANLKDRANGEWHWYTNQKGIPLLDNNKAGPWKAPYHNGRMCIELLLRLNKVEQS